MCHAAAHAAARAVPAHPVAMTFAPLSCPSCPILAMRMRGRRPAAASNRATAFSTAVSSTFAKAGAQGAGRQQGRHASLGGCQLVGPASASASAAVATVESQPSTPPTVAQQKQSAVQHSTAHHSTASTAQPRPHICSAAQGLAVHASGHAACRQRSGGAPQRSAASSEACVPPQRSTRQAVPCRTPPHAVASCTCFHPRLPPASYRPHTFSSA